MQSSLKFTAQRKRALLWAVSPRKVQNINVQTKTDLIMEVDKTFPSSIIETTGIAKESLTES